MRPTVITMYFEVSATKFEFEFKAPSFTKIATINSETRVLRSVHVLGDEMGSLR
jgi:hypothetical protein